jgi:branched-chain amino acid transport system substrate-binding protein
MAVAAMLLSVPSGSYCEDTFNISVISAHSGGAGALGQSHWRGAKVAQKHINDQGGILGRKIKLIKSDTAANPSQAVKVANEVIMGGRAKVFIGGVSSSVGLALASVVEEGDGLLMLCSSQTAKSTGSKCSRHVFRTCTNSVGCARAAAIFMAERYPDVKKWAAINPDYEWGHAALSTFKPTMLENNPGSEFVAETWPKFQETNFESYILKIKATDADGLYSVLYGQDFITFLKQAQEYNLFDQIKVIMDHAAAAEVAEPLGKDGNLVQFWGGGHYHHEAFDNPLNDQFRKTHRELFDGHEPRYASSETYTSIYALKKAIEAAGSFETMDVIKELEGMFIDSVTGERLIRYRDHQTITSNVFTHFAPSDEDPGFKVLEHVTPFSECYYPRVREEEFRCNKW